jgi:hypothetical protein
MVYTFRLFNSYIIDNQIVNFFLGLHGMLITCGKQFKPFNKKYQTILNHKPLLPHTSRLWPCAMEPLGRSCIYDSYFNSYL